MYEELDLFSTSGSEEEARGESDQEPVIRKPKADVKGTKKGTNHRPGQPVRSTRLLTVA